MGGVAQLGERLFCTQEVIGSSPFTSTNRGLAVKFGEIGMFRHSGFAHSLKNEYRVKGDMTEVMSSWSASI